MARFANDGGGGGVHPTPNCNIVNIWYDSIEWKHGPVNRAIVNVYASTEAKAPYNLAQTLATNCEATSFFCVDSDPCQGLCGMLERCAHCEMSKQCLYIVIIWGHADLGPCKSTHFFGTMPAVVGTVGRFTTYLQGIGVSVHFDSDKVHRPTCEFVKCRSSLSRSRQ